MTIQPAPKNGLRILQTIVVVLLPYTAWLSLQVVQHGRAIERIESVMVTVQESSLLERVVDSRIDSLEIECMRRQGKIDSLVAEVARLTAIIEEHHE